MHGLPVLSYLLLIALSVISGFVMAAAPEPVSEPASEWIPYGDPDSATCDPEYPAHDEFELLLGNLDFRHSSTHGRAMGNGGALRGTSWLNRPYDISIDYGVLLMPGRVASDVRSSNDFFGAVKVGWDWDHYWGTQFRVGWSTPDLINTSLSGTQQSDNLFITDMSLLYYPWGDSRFRPYWRAGLGLTDIEYSNRFNLRQQEFLFTIPFGVGLKYQFRRWFVWRAEFMNNLALGQNETSSINNLTITSGFEWRFGGRPSGQWDWAGYGGAW